MTEPRVPHIGDTVAYHHPGDLTDYGAIVTGIGVPPGDDGDAPQLFNLAIFRPRRDEWKWASQGSGLGQFSWPEETGTGPTRLPLPAPIPADAAGLEDALTHVGKGAM